MYNPDYTCLSKKTVFNTEYFGYSDYHIYWDRIGILSTLSGVQLSRPIDVHNHREKLSSIPLTTTADHNPPLLNWHFLVKWAFLSGTYKVPNTSFSLDVLNYQILYFDTIVINTIPWTNATGISH